MSKVRTGVLLFDEWAEHLKPVFYPRYMMKNAFGYYFNCDQIDAAGPLLTMTVPSVKGEEKPDTVEIQIPYGYVKLTLKVKRDNPFGFANA